MSKLVDKERLARLAAALDQRAKAAVQAEQERAMAVEAGLQAAVDAINHIETGILAQAKAHADAEVAKAKQEATNANTALEEAMNEKHESQDAAIQAAQAAADKAQGEVDAAELRLDAIETKNGEQDVAIKAAQDAADKAQGEVDAVEERMEVAEGEIDALQSAVNVLNGDKDVEGSVKKQIADAIDEVNGAAAELEGRVETLEGEMDAVEADIAQVKLDMAAADTQVLADAKKHADDAITALVDSAPDAMNTLNELASAISANQGIYDAYVAEHAAAMAKQKEDLQKEIDDDVAAEAALRLAADNALQEDINTRTKQADFEAKVAEFNEKHGVQDAAIQAAQAAADKAQGEVDLVEGRATQLESRMDKAEADIVANKTACEEAMAQEVIDRNAAIATALEPYSTTEEVKQILGNVVATLALSMEENKVVLRLGGSEGIPLSEVSLDVVTDEDIDAMIAALDVVEDPEGE